MGGLRYDITSQLRVEVEVFAIIGSESPQEIFALLSSAAKFEVPLQWLLHKTPQDLLDLNVIRGSNRGDILRNST